MNLVLGAKHPRVVELRRLVGRRSSRSTEILIEGPRTVGELLDAGHKPSTVVVPESSADDGSVGRVAYRLAADVEYLVVRDHVFDKLAQTVNPQPMLALVKRPRTELPKKLDPDSVVLVLVDVGDPGNVGTMIRAADAAAATAVVVVGGADPWGPKVVRASAGSILRVPVVSGDDARHAADVLTALRGAGARIVGTNVRDGEPHDQGALTPPVAIVMGSEPAGLDDSLGATIDAWTHIRMPGNTESLNVAMAATILLFESRRPNV